MWTELPDDADVSGGVRTENGGLPAQPAVVKEYGRFAYLEGMRMLTFSHLVRCKFAFVPCLLCVRGKK